MLRRAAVLQQRIALVHGRRVTIAVAITITITIAIAITIAITVVIAIAVAIAVTISIAVTIPGRIHADVRQALQPWIAGSARSAGTSLGAHGAAARLGFISDIVVPARRVVEATNGDGESEWK